MTPKVTACRVIRESGHETIVPITIQSDLAGREEARTTFYAGPTARRLGLQLLPQLVTANVWARGDELDVLRAEVTKLLANLSETERPYRDFRLNNIIQAIDAASIHGEDGLITTN
jgi:hypothetical protein